MNEPISCLVAPKAHGIEIAYGKIGIQINYNKTKSLGFIFIFKDVAKFSFVNNNSLSVKTSAQIQLILKSNFMKMINWLKGNHELSSWLQTVGVLVAMFLAVFQLRQSTDALQFTAKANEITLRNSASDLLVGINTAALSNSDAAGEFSGHKRLHLMRIHYFYRAFLLREDSIMDDDHFKAEENYLKWTATLPDFIEVWSVFRESYSSEFRTWVDQTIGVIPEIK